MFTCSLSLSRFSLLFRFIFFEIINCGFSSVQFSHAFQALQNLMLESPSWRENVIRGMLLHANVKIREFFKTHICM